MIASLPFRHVGRRFRRHTARLKRLLGLKPRSRPQTTGLDLLFGTRAIARYMGLSRKQARSVITAGGIPCFTLAGVICARRGSIKRHLRRLERGTIGASKPVLRVQVQGEGP